MITLFEYASFTKNKFTALITKGVSLNIHAAPQFIDASSHAFQNLRLPALPHLHDRPFSVYLCHLFLVQNVFPCSFRKSNDEAETVILGWTDLI